MSAGVVTRSRDESCSPTPIWRPRCGRSPVPDAFQDQHRDLASTSLDTDPACSVATLNHAELPLAQLMRRKTKTGVGFLTPAEI